KMERQEKVRLEIGVSEPFVGITVNAILASARTGEVGDGKVFVLDVDQVHRIRTGELDEGAVTPAGPVMAGPTPRAPARRSQPGAPRPGVFGRGLVRPVAASMLPRSEEAPWTSSSSAN